MFQKKFVDKIKTYILCSVTPPPPPFKHVPYEMWKNRVQPDKSQITIYKVVQI
jgi:hypothetical protein